MKKGIFKIWEKVGRLDGSDGSASDSWSPGSWDWTLYGLHTDPGEPAFGVPSPSLPPQLMLPLFQKKIINIENQFQEKEVKVRGDPKSKDLKGKSRNKLRSYLKPLIFEGRSPLSLRWEGRVSLNLDHFKCGSLKIYRDNSTKPNHLLSGNFCLLNCPVSEGYTLNHYSLPC